MDIQMPIMDGFEATKIIRSLDKNIPIIALTANAMREDIEKTKKAGMNRHLNKPINVEELYKTLLEFIPKKSEKKEIKIENESFPIFKNLNTQKALKMVMGNTKIYKNILKGLVEFESTKLEELNEEDFKRTIHTIKGISGSAGAERLYEIAKEINETLNKSLLPQFYEEFKKVVDEIKSSGILNEKKETISKEKKEALIEKLKEALKSKRPKRVKEVMEEIEKYEIDLKEAKEFIKKFKYKEALEVL
jgi:CheY-like chemotaxis protein